MKRPVRSLLLPILLLSLLTVGAGVAYAHDLKTDSEIVNFRYNDEKDRFQGKVVSERERCVRNRLVEVREDLPGKNRVVGEDRTDSSGFFQVEDKNPKGDYFAKVLRKVRGREGHLHVCRSDRSELITVTKNDPPAPLGSPGDPAP